MNWEQKFLNKIVQGDSRVLLKEIPDKVVDLVITSPPYYKQRDYCDFDGEIGNESTVEEYINNLMQVFHECVRIVKDEGSLVFNLGDKREEGSLLLVPYRFAIEALKREPIKLIHNITWVKLNPTPRQFKRRLVSSTEPFFHFAKTDNYYFNIDDFMTILNRRKERVKISERLGARYFELLKIASLTEEEKKKAEEEIKKAIEDVREGKIAGFRVKIRGIHAPAFGGQNGGRKLQLEKQGFTIIRILGDVMKRDVIECHTETIRGCRHLAIYPEFIIQELIKLLTPKEGLVLDPFVGSGTTAVAAKKIGRKFIGIDINPEYCKYAEERVKAIVSEATIDEYII